MSTDETTHTQPPLPHYPPDERVGQVLNGKLTLKRVLGRGGMGTVYAAQPGDPKGHDVAVKIMHSAHATDPLLVRRFLNEAEAFRRLNHPNIVKVLDVGRMVSSTEPEVLYIVMEQLRGHVLADLLERGLKPAPRRAVNILAQVCEATQHAHDKDLLHRDLKPDNIILVDAPGGEVVAKVLDFGIALSSVGDATRLTRTGVFCGTPAYMSPEHILGEQLDQRSDVYSLAVMAFELFTGKRPFEAKSLMRVCMKHLDAPVPPFSEEARVGVLASGRLESAVRAGMSKDPNKRPATTKAFAAQLIAALESAESGAPRGESPLPELVS